jgi:hypothetical protein
MDMPAHDIQTEPSFLSQVSFVIELLALIGIPSAGSVALVLGVQIPRFAYGESVPLLFAAEVGSLIVVFTLLFALRACLALPTAPRGFYRNVLDFLAMSRWHPSVIATLLGLLVLPPLWYLSTDHFWLISMFRTRGWHALTSVDVHSALDGVAASLELALTGGVPLLFALHMFCR